MSRDYAISAKSPIRVLLVDDHPLMLRGTRSLLEADDCVKVVAEAETEPEAAAAVLKHRPDVVILDIRLRRGNGIDLAKFVRREVPETRILVLTAYDDDQYVRRLLKIGVNGYILKDADGTEVLNAVHTIMQGGTALYPAIATKVVRVLSEGMTGRRGLRGDDLTERENEVLSLLITGARNSDIAEQLGITVTTVQTHVASILSKFGVQSRTQAVYRAIQEGLFVPR